MLRSIFKRPIYNSAIQLFKFLSIQTEKPIRNNYYTNCKIRREIIHVDVFRQFSTKQPRFEEVIVDYDYVKKATTNENILLIDVREPDEIKELGKIPNSVNIPLGNVSTALGTMTEKEFQKLYQIKKPSEDAEIIFYCMSGKRSGMAQQNAFNLGYKNVKNYLGSWIEWSSKMQ
nr:putative thiosulfate sulfurtransferase, mitochondrial [Vanessa tameamea]XP_026492858.1 putative thiosulfate sulfurtransferase, mitochondrial [Vanessa tameamea]